MELKRPAAHMFCNFCDNLKYFAFSRDKTLLACTNGNCITLLKACSFEKVFGSFEVEEHASISHLEFSPDGNFVFSVQRGCVEEFSQSSGNSRWYRWGCFILNGRYIVVREKREEHTLVCLRTIFKRWLKEVDCKRYTSCILRVLEFVEDVTSVWRHMIEIYADLFTYQIWNVDSGSPALIELSSMTFAFIECLCDELDNAIHVSHHGFRAPHVLADAAFANSIFRTLTGPEEKGWLIPYRSGQFDPHTFQKLYRMIIRNGFHIVIRLTYLRGRDKVFTMSFTKYYQ